MNNESKSAQNRCRNMWWFKVCIKTEQSATKGGSGKLFGRLLFDLWRFWTPRPSPGGSIWDPRRAILHNFVPYDPLQSYQSFYVEICINICYLRPSKKTGFAVYSLQNQRCARSGICSHFHGFGQPFWHPNSYILAQVYDMISIQFLPTLFYPLIFVNKPHRFWKREVKSLSERLPCGTPAPPLLPNPPPYLALLGLSRQRKPLD